MEREKQEAVIEAVLFTMGESVSLNKLAELIEDTPSATRKIIGQMQEKMELGFDENGEIVVIDEISQDCIRANDITTEESLTKDTFRQLKSDKEVLNAYIEFNKRLGIL